MFAHISFTALLALPLLATATVLPRGGGDGAACTATGTVQCCASTQSVSLAIFPLLIGANADQNY